MRSGWTCWGLMVAPPARGWGLRSVDIADTAVLLRSARTVSSKPLHSSTFCVPRRTRVPRTARLTAFPCPRVRCSSVWDLFVTNVV